MIRIMKRIAHIMNGYGVSPVAAICMAFIAYFAFHAFNGENSIHALKSLKVQEQELTLVAETVQQERLYYESYVATLSGKAIDPDMLEEQVRFRLGFTHPDEVVVLVP